MKTKVQIDYFKKSGKWYCDKRYDSQFDIFDLENILKEAAQKVLPNMDYTIEIANGEAWNKILVKQ